MQWHKLSNCFQAHMSYARYLFRINARVPRHQRTSSRKPWQTPHPIYLGTCTTFSGKNQRTSSRTRWPTPHLHRRRHLRRCASLASHRLPVKHYKARNIETNKRHIQRKNFSRLCAWGIWVWGWLMNCSMMYFYRTQKLSKIIHTADLEKLFADLIAHFSVIIVCVSWSNMNELASQCNFEPLAFTIKTRYPLIDDKVLGCHRVEQNAPVPVRTSKFCG